MLTLGDDVVLFLGEEITLDAGNYQSYMWNDDNDLTDRYFTVVYNASEEDSVKVWVEVFDGYCKNTDQILIEMFEVEIPHGNNPKW